MQAFQGVAQYTKSMSWSQIGLALLLALRVASTLMSSKGLILTPLLMLFSCALLSGFRSLLIRTNTTVRLPEALQIPIMSALVRFGNVYKNLLHDRVY